jgi:hypothetical protein
MSFSPYAPVSDTNPLPTVAAAPSATLTAGATSSVSFARTADTNAYAALDVIGINSSGSAGSAIHEFTSAGQSGGCVIITGWDITIDATAIPSGMTSFALHIYDASPTAILDNAAFDLVTADQSKHLVQLDTITPADVGSSLYGIASRVNEQVKLASGVTSLFAELVTNGAWTPASGTTFKLRLRTLAV